MKLSLSSKVFYRVPQFPVDAVLSSEWEALKVSIQEASAAFYETIKDVDSDSISTLAPGLRHTIWKYFNRAKYRSTPYGRFAGFGLAPCVAGGEGVVVESEQVLNAYPDWSLTEGMKKSFEELLEGELWLVANSSYYTVGDCIRYLRMVEGSFELSDLEVNEFQLSVLELCRRPILFGDLVMRLGIGSADFGLIEEMIALQLLITGNDPNIIGEEYFKRVGGEAVAGNQYLMAERRYVSGAFDADVFRAMPELLSLLAGVFPVKANDNLVRFIAGFKRKFEGQKVPVMLALDPELGLGYGDMEESGEGDGLVGRLAGKPDQNASDAADQDMKKAILKNLLDGASRDKRVLDLEVFTSGLTKKEVIFQNSMSVVCSVVDGLVFVDMMAGVTANTLLGRFTLENEEITAYAREIAALEAKANPDVLFFDIAYMAEGRVDNINRRSRIYDMQLSILNYDTSDSPLELKDLHLCVVGDELMLFSEKLGKRLVPRQASAYNYLRSDLSLYRLLCDLENKKLQPYFSVSMEKMFPGLSYYPRIQFKNIIVAREKWLVVYKDFLVLFQAGSDVHAVLRSHFSSLGMKQYVMFKAADMTLCFDLTSDADLESLLVLLKKQGEFYLEEAFVAERSDLKDEAGRAYKSQLILALTHGERIYAPYLGNRNEAGNGFGVRRTFPPGSEWLYFEIYCHVYRSDALLGELIAPFLSEYGRYIKSWFFIRYKENGDHLRLRILLHDAGSGQLLVSGLSAVLAEHLESGIVAEMLLKTYKREVERYAAGGMEKVEAHFGVDSVYVLSLLGSDLGVMDKYKLCVWVAVSVMESGLISPVVFERLIGRICDSFAAEHKVEVSGFKELNNEYKVFKKFVPVALEGVALEHGNMFLSSLLSALSGCDIGRRGQLFGDLMHMHVNRLFADQQRTHEMIMYYFLNKELLLRKAMAGKQAVEI